MSEKTYEFEATCEATVRETWRVIVPATWPVTSWSTKSLTS